MSRGEVEQSVVFVSKVGGSAISSFSVDQLVVFVLRVGMWAISCFMYRGWAMSSFCVEI